MVKGARVALLLLLLPLGMLGAQAPPRDAAKARDLFAEKKYADAAALLENVWRGGSPSAPDLILLGMCYTELKELDKAGPVLEAAALLAPRSAPLMDARGNLAFARKLFTEALALFREAHRLDPKDRNAMAGMVASLANQGVELFGQGKADEARSAFQEALTLDPRSVPALRNLGILEMEKGDLVLSARYLERGLENAPRDVEMLKLLFLVRNRQENTAGMLPLLERLIAVQPTDPEPYAARGRLLESQGRQAEAAESFRQAVERGTQDPLPYFRVGSERRSRYLLHDAVGKAVQLIGALRLQASQALGKAKKADDLRGVKLLTARVEEVRATLASSLLLLREIDGDEAFEQDLSRLQSWYPGSVDLSDAMARLYQEKERWHDSLTAWERILQDHPLNGEAQAGAGLALEKTGRKEEAMMAYRRALEIDPGSGPLYSALERLSVGRETELRQMLLDRSYRDTRNTTLLRELARIEEGLGLASDAEAHRARVAEIESGK